jgi:hypothetical protein
LIIKKIIYATVIYSTKYFEIFINDYLLSVFTQTTKDFELLIILDEVELAVVEKRINKLNKKKIKVHIRKYLDKLNPIELRKNLINISYELNADVLIFSDFDENVASNRVEEVIKNIDNYAFAFNDFYVVDKNLTKINIHSFFETRNVPKEVKEWKDIKSFNYIGFGSLSINLKLFNYKDLTFPKEIKALDWFIATCVLLNKGKGIKLFNTYSNYRQHDSSFVGFDFKLDKAKLKQGLNTKLTHYKYFKKYSIDFKIFYNEMVDLQEYINYIGEEHYIEIVNKRFDTSTFCWWENIKTKKELV